MEADDALEVGSAAGEFEDGCAAEAIAGRGEFGEVGAGVLLEHVERGGEAGAEEPAVLLVFTSFLSGRRWLRAYAFTVDVRKEDVVTEGGQLPGDVLFMVADAGPLVDDENAGSLARDCIVIGLPAFAGDLAGFIFHGFLDDGRAERAEEGNEGKGSAAETG